MIRLLKHLTGSEKGVALPIVLGLMAIGGLTIATSLNYATANLNASRILLENTKGIYAAGAGVEHALWSLEEGIATANSTPEDINGMSVSINTIATGNYSLCFGELIEADKHYDYLGIEGEAVWDAGAGAYKYTITVTWQAQSGDPPIKLEAVGARLPPGYTYQTGSTANFTENLDTGEPEGIIYQGGVYLINWELSPAWPDISSGDPVVTQSFYITGSGSLDDDYCWVLATREDVGAVSQIVGQISRITAKAIRPEDGRTIVTIEAAVIIESGKTFLVSWQIAD